MDDLEEGRAALERLVGRPVSDEVAAKHGPEALRLAALREKRQTRAQAAANLVPVGRDGVRVEIRLTEGEAEHLDAIRGEFSRNDAVRLLLRSAEKLGL